MLRWTSTFAVILLLTSCAAFNSEESNRVCVIPTANSTCNCSVPCHTFDYYISQPDSELYQQNFLTMDFLPGIHTVSKSFSSSSHTGLHLVGVDASIKIVFDLNGTSWFSLRESLNISFSNLTFELGEQCQSSQFLFDLESVSDISFTCVNLTNLYGGAVSLQSASRVVFRHFNSCTRYYGISLTNTCENVEISHSILTGMTNYTLLRINYTELLNNSNIDVKHSQFHNGSDSIRVYVSRTDSMLHENNKLKLRFNFTSILCTTPYGGDFKADFLSTNAEVNVEMHLYDFQLPKASTYGILLDFGNFQRSYAVYIVNSSISYHNEAAIRIFNGNTPESSVSVENVTIIHNKASPSLYPVSGFIIKGQLYPNQNPSTVLKNVRFESNILETSSSIYTVVTMMLYYVQKIELIDCHFESNIGTALYLEKSVVNMTGNLTFINNTAYNGAAISVNGAPELFSRIIMLIAMVVLYIFHI